MAREFAQLRLDIWSDPDVRKLTERAQRLYLHLLTSPSLNYAGVADWRPARLSGFASDSTTATITAAAAELAAALFVVIDEDTEEIMIRSFLRHDGLLKQPKVAVSMTTAYAAVASPKLRAAIIHELLRLQAENPEWAAWGRPQVQTLLKHDHLDPKALQVPQGGALPVPQEVALPAPLGDVLPVGLGVALPQRLPSVSGLPTPAPTTATSSNEDGETTEDAGDDEPGFEDFWAAYPKKVAKQAAAKAFIKALSLTTAAAVVDRAARFRAESKGQDPKFIPHPATWLNAGRWDDEPEPDTPAVMTLDDWRRAHRPTEREAEVNAWLEANPDPTW